jgi:hypothetical protein
MIVIVAKNALFGIIIVVFNNNPVISLFLLEFLSFTFIYLLNRKKKQPYKSKILYFRDLFSEIALICIYIFTHLFIIEIIDKNLC